LAWLTRVQHGGEGLSLDRPLRLGDRGDTVVALRRLVERAGRAPEGGAAPAEPDVFDAGLQAAVRAFQQRRGLLADGVVGVQTLRALEGARWRLGDRVLLLTGGPPMRGDDVATLQERLVVLGLLAGPVDGVFGPVTERALRELQRSLGSEADGVCGPATLRAMDALARAVGGGDPWALRQQAEVADAGLSLAGKVVVLDPAHGGIDRGVAANGLNEDDVTFDVASRTATRLRTIGVEPVLTRDRYSGPNDLERAAHADAVGADVVVSLHCDGTASASAEGVATFFWGDDRVGARSATGAHLASLVQREIAARTGMTDLRTHACTFDILRVTKMPAVQVELGYLTHSADAARLADPDFRDLVAEALVVAIQRLYLGEEDAATGTLRLEDVLEYARLVETRSA
jgi:N-acetylmuramoyl-L-alanine amidase